MSGQPPSNSADHNRIYDLTRQAPWMEHAGGDWIAGASSLGNLVMWDTTTFQDIYCSKASTGSIYSCCALPGSNMVAVACPSPQLVQVWDCRQAPENIAAVMTCDVPPRTAGGSATIGTHFSMQCISFTHRCGCTCLLWKLLDHKYAGRIDRKTSNRYTSACAP